MAARGDIVVGQTVSLVAANAKIEVAFKMGVVEIHFHRAGGVVEGEEVANEDVALQENVVLGAVVGARAAGAALIAVAPAVVALVVAAKLNRCNAFVVVAVGETALEGENDFNLKLSNGMRSTRPLLNEVTIGIFCLALGATLLRAQADADLEVGILERLGFAPLDDCVVVDNRSRGRARGFQWEANTVEDGETVRVNVAAIALETKRKSFRLVGVLKILSVKFDRGVRRRKIGALALDAEDAAAIGKGALIIQRSEFLLVSSVDRVGDILVGVTAGFQSRIVDGKHVGNNVGVTTRARKLQFIGLVVDAGQVSRSFFLANGPTFVVGT